MASAKETTVFHIGSQRIGAGSFISQPNGELVLQNYDFTELLADPAADSSRLQQVSVALKELVDRMDLKKSRVRFGIPGQAVFTRFVKIPSLDLGKLDQIVEYEAQQNVPFPLDEVVWDFQLVNVHSASDEIEVMLVAIKSDWLNELHEVVEGAGVTVESVDVAPFAFYNALRYNYPESTEPTLLLDIEARTTNLIFNEGDKVYIRSIAFGGTNITTAISRELQISFAEAEALKKEKGYVSLGGAYADDEDPQKAQLSKIIRNSLSKLHAEVVRTINFYRSQQGGSAPKRTLIAGGSATLPYFGEFVHEKLNTPVEFFHPLRKVSLGVNLEESKVRKDIHLIGELVGLALRRDNTCPLEIELLPEVIEVRRKVAARKPALIVGALALVVFLASWGFFFHRAAQIIERREGDVRLQVNQLARYDKQLKDLGTEVAAVDERFNALKGLVFDRNYWVDLFQEINQRLPSDTIWVTELIPYSEGQPVVGDLYGAESASELPAEFLNPRSESKATATAPKSVVIDEIRLRGLYRESAEGARVVNDFVANLQKATGYFDFGNMTLQEINPVRDTGSGERWAYEYEIRLPLLYKVKLLD